MRNVIGSIALALGVLGFGCVEASGVAKGPATPGITWASAAAPAATIPSQGKLSLGSTRGQMTDPEAHEWQTELLQAMGREGQYELFNYVFVDAPGEPNVYVGVETASLGLSPDEVDAVSAVQTKYAPMGTMMRDGIWMASAWPDHGGTVARAN